MVKNSEDYGFWQYGGSGPPRYLSPELRRHLLEPNESRKLEDNWSYPMPLQTVVVGKPADIRISHSPDNDTRPLIVNNSALKGGALWLSFCLFHFPASTRCP